MKKLSSEKSKTIVVHDGLFHTDDVTSVAILSILFDRQNVYIIRTRDEKIINSAKEDVNSFVIDVGGQYDHKNGLYDHHQRDFHFRIDGIKPSSVGLIFYHYGRELIQKIIKDISTDVSQDAVDIIYSQMLENIIKPIDLSDNGLYKELELFVAKNKEALNIREFISLMNPQWYEADSKKCDERFFEAVAFAEMFIRRFVEKEYGVVKAKEVFEHYAKLHNGSRILVMEQFVPWKPYIKNYPLYKVVIYPSVKNQWVAEAVQYNGKSFSFPKDLWGVEKDRLKALTGCKSIEFVHGTGFLAVFDDKDELIKFCHKAIDLWQKM